MYIYEHKYIKKKNKRYIDHVYEYHNVSTRCEERIFLDDKVAPNLRRCILIMSFGYTQGQGSGGSVWKSID